MTLVPLGRSARRSSTSAPSSSPLIDEDPVELPADHLLCAECGHFITRTSDAIEVAGAHHHTRLNPIGHLYRIRCFRAAPGSVGQSGWSDHYSWFSGYFWQVAECRKCAVHIGWVFRSSLSPPFHGLIEERLASS